MNIIVASGRKNSEYLVKALKNNAHDVIAINQDRGWCDIISDRYDILSICGDASTVKVLKEANAEKMDIVISINDSDAYNFAVCDLAKKRFNVRHTYALVNDMKNVDIFERFGIDKCVNLADDFINILEEHTIEENIKKNIPFENSHISTISLSISKNSPTNGKKLWEINFPPQSIIACLVRNNKSQVPQGNTMLLSGDKLIIVTLENNYEALKNLFH